MNKKKTLIIGGNGFIGENLSKMLSEKKYDVYSFDIVAPSNKINKVNYISGDFFDDISLQKVIADKDVIIHALSTINPGNSNIKYLQGYSKDFIQTVKLCSWVSESKKNLIFLSSGGTVYGKQTVQPIKEDFLPLPINHYGSVKLCIETVIRAFNIQLHSKMRIARISNPYGPGQDYRKGVGFIDAVLKRALNNKTIEIWGDGETVRDYIYIDDVCKMLCSLIEYKGEEEVFNISTNLGVSQNNIIEILRNIGINIHVKYEMDRSVDLKKTVLDNSKILKIYKKGLVPIEDGLKMYSSYLKINYKE